MTRLQQLLEAYRFRRTPKWESPYLVWVVQPDQYWNNPLI